MEILTYKLGELQTNCYVLVDNVSRNAVAIDIAGDEDFLIEEEKRRGFSIKTVLLTHGHFDHMGGVYKFADRGAEVYIGKGDLLAVTEDNLNLSSLFGEKLKPFSVKTALSGGETFDFNGIKVETISTPGHTKGSITYKVEEALFCGDVLFEGSFGRVDFPGGDVIELCKSAKVLLNYKNCELYSGHGDKTTIEKERTCNPINGYIKYYL